jgi:hypothetical protein
LIPVSAALSALIPAAPAEAASQPPSRPVYVRVHQTEDGSVLLALPVQEIDVAAQGPHTGHTSHSSHSSHVSGSDSHFSGHTSHTSHFSSADTPNVPNATDDPYLDPATADDDPATADDGPATNHDDSTPAVNTPDDRSSSGSAAVGLLLCLVMVGGVVWGAVAIARRAGRR